MATPNSNLTLQHLIASLSRLTSSAASADPDLRLIELRAGDILFEQGDDDDGLYLLLAGSLGVRVRHDEGAETEINRHAPGAIVGEMAAISGQKRTATVYAINDAGLFHLSRAQVDALVAEDPRTERVVEQSFDERWQVLRLSRLLGDLVGDLDPLTLHTLQEEVQWLRLANGDVVFRQGDPVDGMYIVASGRLRIVADSAESQPQLLGEITPGETVGEFAVLTGDPRSATVYAVRDSSVVKIPTATFHTLARTHPDFMTAVTKIIVNRQQRLLGQGRPAAPTALSIALIGAGDSADIDIFAQQLADALRRFDSTVVVNAAQFDAQSGKPGAAQTARGDALDELVSVQLDELEAAQTVVLYAADAGPTAWTRRCLGRADRVLIVADPTRDDPAPGSAERLLAEFEAPIRTELVLWHPSETVMPSGTRAWLAPRELNAHYHVRRGDRDHMQRLARRLTGRAIAVVFSGGGALGLTEMGVYQAMVELGIPIDYVGGTSMGAIMTGGVAVGFTPDEFEAKARQMAATGVMDITLPLAALTASKNVSTMLEDMFGGVDIEDLWLPYFCISCNYSLAETVVHQRGPLWRAIRASMSVPGVFLPVVEDGNVLVDGGIMDNFPVETMLSLCDAGAVIGVVISPFKERKREYDYDLSLSGWKVLRNRLNPFSKPLRTPSMLRTLLRASEINGMRTSKRQERLVDLLITPNVKGYSFSDYDAWQPLAQSGYDAALEPLRAWQASREDLMGIEG